MITIPVWLLALLIVLASPITLLLVGIAIYGLFDFIYFLKKEFTSKKK